jgi:hypothetical protein
VTTSASGPKDPENYASRFKFIDDEDEDEDFGGPDPSYDSDNFNNDDRDDEPMMMNHQKKRPLGNPLCGGFNIDLSKAAKVGNEEENQQDSQRGCTSTISNSSKNPPSENAKKMNLGIDLTKAKSIQ